MGKARRKGRKQARIFDNVSRRFDKSRPWETVQFDKKKRKAKKDRDRTAPG